MKPSMLDLAVKMEIELEQVCRASTIPQIGERIAEDATDSDTEYIPEAAQRELGVEFARLLNLRSIRVTRPSRPAPRPLSVSQAVNRTDLFDGTIFFNLFSARELDLIRRRYREIQEAQLPVIAEVKVSLNIFPLVEVGLASRQGLVVRR